MVHDMGLEKMITVLLVGAIGNALEWYDFAVFGYVPRPSITATSDDHTRLPVH